MQRDAGPVLLRGVQHHLAQRRYDEARPGQEPAVEVKRGTLPECTLTARESEVLGLLAQGCSNRDIGGRLFISETTAKFHVGSLLEKLDATFKQEQSGGKAPAIPERR